MTVPDACATCDCLGAAVCPSGSVATCYDLADPGSASPACVSGIACSARTCTHGASSAPCGAAPCPTGSICRRIYSGVAFDASSVQPICTPIPKACAANPSCECLGPTLCLGDNAFYTCSDDDAGCSSDIGCGNN
jgi:hypothetical protein